VTFQKVTVPTLQ